ncbi:MAG: copper chaperone PCu(A)C [Rhodospirillales bacterium]|nr:MAG: copper chaperone PCu(A)C [Rhodospirillales bacterium]
MITRRTMAATAAALAFIASTATAHDFKLGDLKIDHPWARETASMARAGAAFMVIENAGGGADRLVKASSPVAARTEIHTMIKDGDVMRMREVPAIDLAPRAKVELKPGGFHVMLMELKAPLKAGDKVPVTLTFEKAGAITIEVLVEKMSGPPAVHKH